MTVKAKTIKESKKQKVAEVKEKIEASKVMILTDFRGMTVKQITELRKKLRENKAEYKIFKNTFVVKALRDEFSSLKDQLAGTIAIVFGFGDIAAPAKTLVKFIGENEKPQLLSGVVENKISDQKQIKELSKLPGRKELLGKVIGGLNAPLYNFVSVLQGPIRKLVYALDAVKSKKIAGGEK